MKRDGAPFVALLACVVLGSQFCTVGVKADAVARVKADAVDDLLRALAAAHQDVISELSAIARGIEDDVRLTHELRELKEAIKTSDEQASKLHYLIAVENENLTGNDLKKKIAAIKEQIEKLEEQAKKLAAVLERITTLLPKILDALGQDQSAKESRQILDAVTQDRAKVAKLLQAIEDNRRAEIGDLLGQGARGTKVEVRETSNTDGAKVVFGVGYLIHCVSTKAQCGGRSSSLTKAKTGPVPSAVEAVKPLRDSLAAASRQAAISAKAIESALSDFKAALDSWSDLSRDQAIELQRKATQAAQAETASSNTFQKVASALDAIIRNIKA